MARSSWASQAKINSLLRYSPQREALAQLAREAREQYKSTISDSRSNARFDEQAINRALPATRGIYDRAQRTAEESRSRLAPELAALGPAAGAFAGAAATESAAANEARALARAQATSGLESQRAAAGAAPAYAQQGATQTLLQALRKITSSEQGLGSQEGLATASEIARLEKEARGEALTKRGQNLSHNDRVAALRQEREEGGQRREKANAKAANTVREIEGFARHLFHEGHSRAEIEDLISEGEPQQTYVVDPKTHKRLPHGEEKGGESVTVPARKAYEKGALLDAALDSSIGYEGRPGYGAVSRGTLKKLHASGYSLKALSLNPPHARRRDPGR